ncbi:MAG: hypothetical protein QM530_08340 [Phycisphaerales bacterium]|nr:hypothetical protein [Phycisphaerales bacterium]
MQQNNAAPFHVSSPIKLHALWCLLVCTLWFDLRYAVHEPEVLDTKNNYSTHLTIQDFSQNEKKSTIFHPTDCPYGFGTIRKKIPFDGIDMALHYDPSSAAATALSEQLKLYGGGIARQNYMAEEPVSAIL